MHMRLARIDLPETSDLLCKLSIGQEAPSTLAFDVILERDFCSREQAHSDVRFADGGKATSY